MEADILNPLGEQHLRDINAALAKIALAKQAIAKAKAAGVDVGTAESDALATETQLRQIKQVYFPGR